MVGAQRAVELPTTLVLRRPAHTLRSQVQLSLPILPACTHHSSRLMFHLAWGGQRGTAHIFNLRLLILIERVALYIM